MGSKLTSIQSSINTKANAADVYTKQETESAISTAINNIPATDLTGYATTSYVGTYYLSKTDASSTYATKSQVYPLIDEVNGVKSDLQSFKTQTHQAFTNVGGALTNLNSIKANSADVYTQTAADDKFATKTELSAKANSADVYTQTAADDKFATKTELSAKANSADVYTKSEVYTKTETNNLVNTAVSNLSIPFTKLQIGEFGKSTYDVHYYYFKGQSVWYAVSNPNNSSCVIVLFLRDYRATNISNIQIITPGNSTEIHPRNVGYFIAFKYTTFEHFFYKYYYNIFSDIFFHSDSQQTNFSPKYPQNCNSNVLTRFADYHINICFVQTYNGETLYWYPDQIYILDLEYNRPTHGISVVLPFNYTYTVTTDIIAGEYTQVFKFNFTMDRFINTIFQSGSTLSANKTIKALCLDYAASIDRESLTLMDGPFVFKMYYGDDPETSDSSLLIVNKVGTISNNRTILSWNDTNSFNIDCRSIMPYIWS